MKADIGIIGAGILGVSIAFWLSEVYDASIIILESEQCPGLHASSRNTGVIHRPFYLDPGKRRVFSRTAEKSYELWQKLANAYSLPWKQCGTLEVATRETDMGTLEKYKRWSVLNGMKEEETELLDPAGIGRLEKEVKGKGALFSRTDVSVNFGKFTSTLFDLSRKNGVKLLGGTRVKNIEETKEEVKVKGEEEISFKFVINAAGGGALDLAHKAGIGRQYASLNFRGEYWRVDEPFASLLRRNVYSVPKHGEFPFLDPHFIVRASGTREIGPNAIFVFGPEAYTGLSSSFGEIAKPFLERPHTPRVRLFTNRNFVSLVLGEWKSSLSRRAMVERVRSFIPSLSHSKLGKRGISGVRSSLIDKNGFVPEALLLHGDNSIHVLNYNSPGATGAPSYSAYLVSLLQTEGFFDGLALKQREEHGIWNFGEASNLDS